MVLTGKGALDKLLAKKKIKEREMEKGVSKTLDELEEKLTLLSDKIDILENPKLYKLGDSYKGQIITAAERKEILIPLNHPEINKHPHHHIKQWVYTLLDPKTESTDTINEFDIDPKFIG